MSAGAGLYSCLASDSLILLSAHFSFRKEIDFNEVFARKEDQKEMGYNQLADMHLCFGSAHRRGACVTSYQILIAIVRAFPVR